jgi:hypothetical protein
MQWYHQHLGILQDAYNSACPLSNHTLLSPPVQGLAAQIHALLTRLPQKRKKGKTTQPGSVAIPHINLGKGAALLPVTVLLHHKKEKGQWGSGGLHDLPETFSYKN